MFVMSSAPIDRKPLKHLQKNHYLCFICWSMNIFMLWQQISKNPFEFEEQLLPSLFQCLLLVMFQC